jgi:hypothetical protein
VLGAHLAFSADQLAPRPAHQVKALWLYNFTKYVTWPAEAMGTPTAPFVIGMLAGAEGEKEGDVARALDAMTKNKQVDGRAIRVQRVRTEAEMKACHILYLGASDKRRCAQVANIVTNTPVLTVSDSEDPEARATAMISFLRLKERVRLRIDLNLAWQAHLNPSAKLSGLADEVEGGAAPRKAPPPDASTNLPTAAPALPSVPGLL